MKKSEIPEKLYIFLPKQHVENYLAKGRIKFQPISFFRSMEEQGVIGDAHDGLLSLHEATGITITKVDTGENVFLHNQRLISSPSRPEDIQIYCMSHSLNDRLRSELSDRTIIEIANPKILISKMRSAIQHHFKGSPFVFVPRLVEYRSPNETAGITWALPEKMAFLKGPNFAYQNEFRISIFLNGSHLMKNINVAITEITKSQHLKESDHKGIILEIGKLRTIAKIVT